MLDFLKQKQGANALVDQLARETASYRGYPVGLTHYSAGRQILESHPDVQAQAALAIVAWFRSRQEQTDNMHLWSMRYALFELLGRGLPLTETDLLRLLDWSVGQSHGYMKGIPQMTKCCAAYLKGNPLTEPLREKIENLIESSIRGDQTAESRRWILQLQELIGDTRAQLLLESADVWANTALHEIGALVAEKQAAWAELLLCCLRKSGSSPSPKWIENNVKLVDIIGRNDFFEALLRWFPLANQPREALFGRFDNGEFLRPVNADLLRGLVWLASQSGTPEIARSVSALAISAYRKVPGRGPRTAKVGNACFWALGNMPGTEGVSQLSILKAKIKTNSAQKVITNTLAGVASRIGMIPEEFEEQFVPSYGLDDVGLARIKLGDLTCEIRVDGVNVTQNWSRAGKQLSSPSKQSREQFAEKLKEITQSVKDLRRMLPAQRDRIENLYLQQRSWRFLDWRDRYLDHPLVGTMARRLIWRFTNVNRAGSAIWLDGRLVDCQNEPLTWIDNETKVELWHPLHESMEEVQAWRAWLLKHEIRQPFKQAHREIYILTDAERSTHTYSNRFAAHILRQHQFNALCAARGWKNALRLMVDAELPPAMKILPSYGLRAEYWVEGIGQDYRTDANASGSYLYLATDQVRFYHIDTVENSAHAGGGGYRARAPQGVRNADPLSLEEIPQLVFSEILRDVDLFVGVASVGNDPNWLDGGGQVRYRDYWHNFSFGELNETAKTRKQLLETLLPRLKIADRCRLTDKFLEVRGELRTYKIHLGSSNILMEPNDQYLCIVPSRQVEANQEGLFLPFEGDSTLSVILSKAFLLAADFRISDPSITRQIKH